MRSAERESELQSRWELPLRSVGLVPPTETPTLVPPTVTPTPTSTVTPTPVSVFPSVEPELALQLMWESVFPSVEPELALQLMWESVLLSAGRVSVFPSVEPELGLVEWEWVLQCGLAPASK